MRVLLHAGFHKSGTTSIQARLLNLDSPSIWYPKPLRLGPGHCVLAHSALSPNSPDYNPDLLAELADSLEQSMRRGAPHATLVLSSECFTTMPELEAIRRLTDKHSVHLLLTRRPVMEALPSFQQELIKHGSPSEFLSRKGLREAKQHMQFNAEQILKLIEIGKFSKIQILSTSKKHPEFLFSKFGEILGLDLPPQTLNKSQSLARTVEMAKLNAVTPHLDVKDRLSRVPSEGLSIGLGERFRLEIVKFFCTPIWWFHEQRMRLFFRNLAARGKVTYEASKSK